MDVINIIPARLEISESVIACNNIEPFVRDDLGKQAGGRPQYMRLTLKCGRSRLLTIIAHPLLDWRWKATGIRANLPALRWGHNGRPLRRAVDLALALTRLKHFVGKVTSPGGHHLVVPGVGQDNSSYIKSVELMIQIVDPRHRFLRATHQMAVTFQHKAPLVVWGESTRFVQDATDFSIYDKIAALKGSCPNPLGCAQTRVECFIKDPVRLARDVGLALSRPLADETVVSTLSVEDGYGVLRHLLACRLKLPGLGVQPSRGLSKTASLLILGLGRHLDEPGAVNSLLDDYRATLNPGDRTYRGVAAEVRAAAIERVLPSVPSLLPESFDSLAWADADLPAAQRDYDAFLTEWQAPHEPDPQILAAWSVTSFLKAKPTPADLTGTVSLRGCPWIKLT